MNEQETLLSPDVSQLIHLSCLELFCQIHLTCAPISMGGGGGGNLYCRLLISFSQHGQQAGVFLMVIGLSGVPFGL